MKRHKIWICRQLEKSALADVYPKEPTHLVKHPFWGLLYWVISERAAMSHENRATSICVKSLERIIGEKLPPFPDLLEAVVTIEPIRTWQSVEDE